MTKYRHFIIACFIFSFLFSLLLLWGPIEDFFEYYYMGRAIVWGRDMFADVAENKGPIFNMFIATAYAVFGTNYAAALVVGSTILDGAFCAQLILLFQHWIGPVLPKKKLFQWGFALLTVMYVKSFSIGAIRGGLYSEQLAMALVVCSLLLLEKKHYVFSGVSMACAVLSRQSVAGFLLVAGIRLWFVQKQFRTLVLFLLGFGIVVGGFTLYVWQNGTLVYAIENMYIWTYWYRRTVSPLFWPTAVTTIFIVQIRAFWSLLFVVLFSLYYFIELRRSGLLYLYSGLCVASILAVFGGGMVWGHYFFQWTIIFLFCAYFMWVKKRNIILLEISGIGIFIFVCFSYTQYVRMGMVYGSGIFTRLPFIQEIAEKKYLLAISPQSKLYLDYQKESPDRYYSPLFWLNPFYTGEWTQLAISRHKQIPQQRLRETAFVFASPKNSVQREGQWYLDQFEKKFQLIKQAEYLFSNDRVEIYFSAL